MSEFLRPYGQGVTIRFPLVGKGTNDYINSATFGAGDTLLYSESLGLFTNTAYNPSHVTNGIYSLLLSTNEMSASEVPITVIDLTAVKVWQDQTVYIRTYGNASAGLIFDLGSANVTVGTNSDKTGYALSEAATNEINQTAQNALTAYDAIVPGDLTGGTMAMSLLSLAVNNSAGDAVTFTASGGNGSGMVLVGNGSGSGLSSTGGATGYGAKIIGGSTSGGGCYIEAGASGSGIELYGKGAGEGIIAKGVGAGRHGASIYSLGDGGSGMRLAGNNAGNGLLSIGGTTGDGINTLGGATSGAGISSEAQADGDGLELIGAGTGVDLDTAWPAEWDAEVESECVDALLSTNVTVGTNLDKTGYTTSGTSGDSTSITG
jgi:hypothetical protein